MSELVEEEVCDTCLFSCRAIWMSCHSSSVRFSGRKSPAGGAEFSSSWRASWKLSKSLILTFFDVSDSDTSFFVLFFLQSTGHRHYIVHRALARNAPKTCYHYKKIAPSNNGEDYFRTGSRRSLSTLALHYIKIPLCLSSCRLVPSYVWHIQKHDCLICVLTLYSMRNLFGPPDERILLPA